MNTGIDCSVLQHKSSCSEFVNRSLDHHGLSSDLLLWQPPFNNPVQRVLRRWMPVQVIQDRSRDPGSSHLLTHVLTPSVSACTSAELSACAYAERLSLCLRRSLSMCYAERLSLCLRRSLSMCYAERLSLCLRRRRSLISAQGWSVATTLGGG